jgi:phage tail-like protein
MRIIRIVADPSGFDRALDDQGRHWGSFINLDQEYIELHNDSDEPQDLSQWVLRDASIHRFVFPAGTVVSPRGTLRVRSGQGQNTNIDLFWNRQAPVWNNLGDQAFLFDDQHNQIDECQFPDFTTEMPPAFLPQLHAESHPGEGAIALSWDIPLGRNCLTFPHPDALPLFILRRERRFPGTNRRGTLPMPKQLVPLPDEVTPEARSNLEEACLTAAEDGLLIYNTVDGGFEADFETHWEEPVGDRRIVTDYQYADAEERRLLRSVRKESLWSPVEQEFLPHRMTVRVIDRDRLTPGTVYYYTAFAGGGYVFSSQTQASALATGRHDHQFFNTLPQIHQQLDTVLPEQADVAADDRHKGQLQRLLEVFEAHADMLHGRVGGLQDVHNIRRVNSHLLPPLAHLIGWQFKDLANEENQRRELTFAKDFYKTTGTFGLIKAIIHLLTGWQVEMREMAPNVLTSFDSRRLEAIGGQTVYLDGTLQPSRAYREYLEYVADPEAYLQQRQEQDPDRPEIEIPVLPPEAERWQGRQWTSAQPAVPMGSLNLDPADPTRDDRLAKLYTTTPYDPNVYSFHAPPPREAEPYGPLDDENLALYNQKTIALYLRPKDPGRAFTPDQLIADRRRLYQLLQEFLPINVRVIVFIRPLDVEEFFDPVTEVNDDWADRWVPWMVLISNEPDHRSVDTANWPPDMRHLSWFEGATGSPPEDETEEDNHE